MICNNKHIMCTYIIITIIIIIIVIIIVTTIMMIIIIIVVVITCTHRPALFTGRGPLARRILRLAATGSQGTPTLYYTTLHYTTLSYAIRIYPMLFPGDSPAQAAGAADGNPSMEQGARSRLRDLRSYRPQCSVPVMSCHWFYRLLATLVLLLILLLISLSLYKHIMYLVLLLALSRGTAHRNVARSRILTRGTLPADRPFAIIIAIITIMHIYSY